MISPCAMWVCVAWHWHSAACYPACCSPGFHVAGYQWCKSTTWWPFETVMDLKYQSTLSPKNCQNHTASHDWSVISIPMKDISQPAQISGKRKRNHVNQTTNESWAFPICIPRGYLKQLYQLQTVPSWLRSQPSALTPPSGSDDQSLSISFCLHESTIVYLSIHAINQSRSSTLDTICQWIIINISIDINK